LRMTYFRAVLCLSLCLSVAGCGSLFKVSC
jgi:hypothetical protein